MMPLYGFVQGDSMGLVVLAQEQDTVADLAMRLQTAAQVRVPARVQPRVRYQDRLLDPKATLRGENVAALSRIDLVWPV